MITLMVVTASAQQPELVATRAKRKEVPQSVTNAIKKDFPNLNISGLKVVPSDVYKREWEVREIGQVGSSDKANFYTVAMNGKNFHAHALYNGDGKLVYYREVVENTALPETVAKAIREQFPEWTLAGDREVIKNGRKEITYYRVRVENGKEQMHLFLNPSGQLLKKTRVENESMHHAKMEKAEMNKMEKKGARERKS